MNQLIRGAIAGTLATLPMTLVIESINRSLPPRERKPLPPRQITEQVAERTGAEKRADERTLDVATMTTHFAFGAAMGACYGLLAPRARLSPALTGTGFGLLVWTANYAGVLPALRLQRWPQDRPPMRNTTMIVGHIVWGSVLGLVESRLRSRLAPPQGEYERLDSAMAKTRLQYQEW